MAAHNSIEVGADILNTTRNEETKSILAQIGDVEAETVSADNVEMWSLPGFASRPQKAEPGKSACQGLVLNEGGSGICFATKDLRGQEIAGNLKEGETCLYAPGADGTGQARVLLKGDSSMALFTRASATAKGMGLFLYAKEDAIRLLNAAGNGLIIDNTGVYLVAGSQALKLELSGAASLLGAGQTQVDGASVVIGNLAVPVANAALTGPTGITAKPSVKVLIE